MSNDMFDVRALIEVDVVYQVAYERQNLVKSVKINCAESLAMSLVPKT